MEQKRNSVSQKKLIVAAIDFGTTYSGYAYSTWTDYKNDRLKIFTNTNWEDGQLMSLMKTPTVILFDKDGKFDSFGFEAERKYAELSSEYTEESKNSESPVCRHIGWRYFSRFKMVLLKRKRLRLDMKLKDDQNNTMSAIDVFTASIRFLKDHMLKRMSQRYMGTDESDIQWVITVPAIWDNAAKQFMQEAAERACISENQVCLALEPEAAALYCKEITISKICDHNTDQQYKLQLQSFRPGAQFMVLDLGGGTVDVSVHEVNSDGTLEELIAPSGGPWGGTLVDNHLEQKIEELFGKDVIARFKKEYREDELFLKRLLESKKRSCRGSVSEESLVTITVPVALFECFNVIKEKEFSLSNNSEVTLKGGKLQFKTTAFHAAFEEAKTKIISHLKDLLGLPCLENVKTILMVGGFAHSEILKQVIEKEFKGKKSIILPEEADLAVVKGAVIYGHDTNSISQRVLRHTYGISTSIPFDPRIHPLDKKQATEDKDICKCEDVFKVFIRAGDRVTPNITKVTHTVNAHMVDALTPTITIEIYQSDTKNPAFISDDGCKQVADLLLTLQHRSEHEKQKIDITMWFGDTVLHVEALEQKTN